MNVGTMNVGNVKGAGTKRCSRKVPPEDLLDIPHPCPNELCSECTQQYRTVEDQIWENHCYYQESLTTEDIWPSKEVNDNVRKLQQAFQRHTILGKVPIWNIPTVKHLANQIIGDYQYLKQQCAVHGDIIIERWKKYKVNRREKILKEADPNFNPKQWFHIEINFNPGKRNCRIGNNEAERNHLFFEYINLEAFREDNTRLLNLLFNRAQHHPDEFVIFDSCQLKHAWMSGQVNIYHNTGCLVMHGAQYGELVHWGKNEAHRWDIIGFPRAKLILQAQVELMSLLRKILDIILLDVDTSLLPTPIQSSLVRSVDFNHSDIHGFSGSYYNEPYSAPLKFDIDKIFNIANEQLKVKKDHLKKLQIDPAYAKYWLDLLSNGHLARDKSPKAFCKEGLLANGLYAELQSIRLWTEIVQEVVKVKKLHDSIGGQIRRGQALPTNYNRALGALEVLLVDYMSKLRSYLISSIHQRPSFSKHRMDKELNESEDPLYFYLDFLVQDPYTPSKFSKAMMFRRLETYLKKASKEEQARIDEVLNKLLSQWAAFHQILRMVRYHSPRHEKRALKDIKKDEKGDSWLYTKKNSLADSPETPQNIGPKIAKLMKIFSKLPIPSGKKDEDWIKSDMASRKALSDIWEAIRDYQKIQLRYLGMTDKNMETEIDTLSADMNPKHIAYVTAHHDGIRAKIKDRRAGKANKPPKPSQGMQTIWEDEAGEAPKLLATSKNTKTKTRPDGHTFHSDAKEADTAQVAAVEEISAITKPRIEISSKKAFRLFSSMYRDPGSDQDLRNVPWEEFRSSMVEIGFDCNQRGGSSVAFTAGDHLGWAKGRKICFHKPHPEPHISPAVLQVWSKRLTKHFGFEKDTFVYTKNTNSQNNLVSEA